MHDIDEFLRRHAPFDDLSDDAREELVRATEVEFFAAGSTVFREGEGPLEHVRIVRKGAIELVSHGEVLDVLGEGELFGHPSMLSGLPAWFEARAGEDTLAYRLPASSVVPLLGRPSGLRFVARSLAERPRLRALPAVEPDRNLEPVARLVHGPPVICEPSWTVREVAELMAEAEESAAVIRLGDGELGIVTDRDLRNRVVAGPAGPDTAIAEVMTVPAVTTTPERTGAEVMLEMLARDIHHIPVVWPQGDVMGVLGDRDLLVAEAQAPFALRREISEAENRGALGSVAKRLRSTVVAFHEAELPPSRIAAIITVVGEAISSRLLELNIRELGTPPAPLAWLSLGSIGRREAVPSSDVETGLIWDHAEGETVERYMRELAGRTVEGLEAADFRVDEHGVTAAAPVLDRSFESWRAAIRDVIRDPEQEQGLIFISLLADARRTYRHGSPRDPLEELGEIRHRRALLRLLLRLALVHRPPKGLRWRRGGSADLETADGRLDVKRAGLLPIVGIARYASLAAGGRATATQERLAFASTAGTLEPGDARGLADAFDLLWRLRLDHQVDQLRRGAEPDNLIDVTSLTPVTRGYLRDAFHGVAEAQRALKGELALPP
jgi:CBS domain-containing protein